MRKLIPSIQWLVSFLLALFAFAITLIAYPRLPGEIAASLSSAGELADGVSQFGAPPGESLKLLVDLGLVAAYTVIIRGCLSIFASVLSPQAFDFDEVFEPIVSDAWLLRLIAASAAAILGSLLALAIASPFLAQVGHYLLSGAAMLPPAVVSDELLKRVADGSTGAKSIGLVLLAVGLFVVVYRGYDIVSRLMAGPIDAELSQMHHWYADVPRSAKVHTTFGYVMLFITVVGFGYWSATAMIAGAIVTSGSFVATGANKIVQHFEGGVIDKILVSEGDIVEAGQTLLTLDETVPRTELRRLQLREARASAIAARLEAEISDIDSFKFPQFLLDMNDDPDIAGILDAEMKAFAATRRNLNSQIQTLEEGIHALEQRMRGSRTQLHYVRDQVKYFEEELTAKEQLLKRGLIRISEVLALRRGQANARGEIGRLLGEIGDAQERAARIKEQIASVRHAQVKEAIARMDEVSTELKDVREQILAAESVLNRVSIVAPVRGAVVRLRYHTKGGVIEAGKPIMEILPLQEELIIEARVRPQDIDAVKSGQTASVRLTALNSRITPSVSGKVIYVSADALDDEEQINNKEDIYIARVKLNAEEANKVASFSPTPGMPVEVFIKTADRTFLEYLTKPVVDSMARAFRES